MNKEITKANLILAITSFVLFIAITDVVIYYRASNDRSELNETDEVEELAEKLYTDSINKVESYNNADINSWNEYENKKYGINFSYPKYFKEFIPPSVVKDGIDFVMVLTYIDDLAGPITYMVGSKESKSMIDELVDKGGKVSTGIINIDDISFSSIDFISFADASSRIIFFERNNKYHFIIGEKNDVLIKIARSIKFSN